MSGIREKWIEIQKTDFIRMGVIGDFDNRYVTFDPHLEAKEIEVFGEMARKGYIYKGKKAVYWCPHCETALAEAEIEYKDRKSPSIYVKFPAKNIKGLGPEGVDQSKLLPSSGQPRLGPFLPTSIFPSTRSSPMYGCIIWMPTSTT